MREVYRAAVVGDIELDPAKLEPEETLKLYVNGPPAGDRVPTIHDVFIKVAAAPTLAGPADHERARKQIIGKLRADTFHHFPKSPPPLALEEAFALDGGVGTRFAFTSEDGLYRRLGPPAFSAS
jgi:hypothetical protein